MEIKVFTFNVVAENTYILYDDTKECVIVDAGCYDTEEEEVLVDFIEANALHVKYLINTHCHLDHILGSCFVVEKYKVPYLIPKGEHEVHRMTKVMAPMWGLHEYQEIEPTGYIVVGKPVRFGSTELEVLSVPGHSPDHVAFYNKLSGQCIAGDVLFRQSIGRTDLPGGNFDVLEKSIKNVLYSLPEDTIVYPGHGLETTIAFEKRNNPFVKG